MMIVNCTEACLCYICVDPLGYVLEALGYVLEDCTNCLDTELQPVPFSEIL